jgi:3-phenylpropionate/trans-cinnamate dioxygenase ferredoxin subunit
MGTLVVDVEELEPGGLLPVKVGERKVLVCRVADEYFAIENLCPHATVPLSRGRLDDCVLECPFHGGKLDVRSGRPLQPPIRRPVATFSVRRVDGGIEIDTGVRAGS